MKKILSIFMFLFLLSSCGSYDDNVEIESNNGSGVVNETGSTSGGITNNGSEKGVIEETADIIEGYGDTLKGAIDGARDVKNTIESRYSELQNMPR